MMKYFILLSLLISQALVNQSLGAQLVIKFDEPKLLLQQISATDLSAMPSLNEAEQSQQKLISDKLNKAQYADLLATLKQRPKADMSAAMAYLIGQLALQQQQLSLGADFFTHAIKLQANFGKAYHGLGLAQLQSDNPIAATKNFAKALQLGVNDPQIYSFLGYGYIQSEHFHSAVVAYQQAKLFNPDDAQLNQALLYAYTMAGHHDAALSLLEQMLNAMPNDQGLWLHRANALLKKDQFSQAIASLEAAIRLGESNADNLALTAQLQLQHGSINRARTLYARIWQTQTNAPLVFEACEYLIANQEFDAAKALLKKMSLPKSSPHGVQSQLAYLNGLLAQQQGSTALAARSFEQALSFNGVNGKALLALAAVKRSQQQSHQAQMLLLRAGALDEVKLQALTEHADLMMALGRYPKALELLQQAADFAPQEPSLFENIQILQRLVRQDGA
ncbi:tetratricopeptide repeat protein [Shewanella frigidimarina]|uniref:tetratricopeptide repeat protein n=1 Tax=Shewanella frigidimarina TaxID=56812 RepID=UPI003D7BBC45